MKMHKNFQSKKGIKKYIDYHNTLQTFNVIKSNLALNYNWRHKIDSAENKFVILHMTCTKTDTTVGTTCAGIISLN